MAASAKNSPTANLNAPANAPTPASGNAANTTIGHYIIGKNAKDYQRELKLIKLLCRQGIG